MNKVLVLLVGLVPLALSRSALQAPPPTWQEHWFEHAQLLRKVFNDDDVAVYFDNDVDPSITWPNQFLGDVFRYTKQVYGSFGQENNLYAVFHTGKYSGGHPSTYFDASHDFRNVIDCGSSSSEAWLSGQGNDLDIVTHEVAHVVEIASKNTHGSPAFRIWGDSKWAEIFNYDVYKNLGMTSDATRWFNMMNQSSDDFPTRGTFWFRDWFYPIYNQHGESAVLNSFFTLLSQHFPKNGNSYARDLNFGEFVHFWSGAARTNLQPLAESAFTWTSEWNTQFLQAQSTFPGLPYQF